MRVPIMAEYKQVHLLQTNDIYYFLEKPQLSERCDLYSRILINVLELWYLWEGDEKVNKGCYIISQLRCNCENNEHVRVQNSEKKWNRMVAPSAVKAEIAK